MIITPLLYLGEKDLEEIQLIITSIKVPNLIKQVIGITRNLAIMVKKKRP